jgi:ABC-2 type transport system ATP-binding protein
MTGDAIVADGLTFSYGDGLAVNHVSFTVPEGTIFGFLGPNGAGKTTTLKMLTGQLMPQKGKATLLGMDIARQRDQIQAQIGVCFEITNLYEQMSAEENLKLFARLFGVNGFEPGPLLERVGLAGREKDRVGQYSKGMKRRLMVARALVNSPKILFLDEPTEGLDPSSAENVRQIIREERSRGATIFLTTHDMVEADKLSDAVAFINGGEIVALDTSHNLKQRYGERIVRVEVLGANGQLESREVVMDNPETAESIQALFSRETVVTVHSSEATLEDIFIQMTGRGLTG